MKKRMIDQDIFDNDWFMALSPKHKLFWQWLFLHADMAGVISKINYTLASVQIGKDVCCDDLAVMEDNIIRLPCGKYIIPKFIEFQYGKHADISDTAKSMVHRGVWRCLKQHGLSYPVQKDAVSIPIPKRINRVS